MADSEGVEEGECGRRRLVYGVVTVSSKGQVSIPVAAREDLGIREGDRLLVLKRRDCAGITLIKLELMDELMARLQEDEGFFLSLERDRPRGGGESGGRRRRSEGG